MKTLRSSPTKSRHTCHSRHSAPTSNLSPDLNKHVAMRTEWAMNTAAMTAFEADSTTVQGELSPTAASLRRWATRVAALLRGLGPYVLIELLLPGGSVIALLLWLYRQRLGQK